MSVTTKVLIGVGVSLGVAAAGAGAVAATSATSCSAVIAAYAADVVSKLGDIAAAKTVEGISEVTVIDSDYEEAEE